jgi:dTDP-4-dehydrorhamnose reductase
MPARPILVTGGSGQVGSALARLTAGSGRAIAFPPRAELDLADPASIRRMMAARDWGAVISCAAYTAVDKAESEADAAFAANATAPGALADASAALGIPIVHVSTDYVFDGSADGAYDEHDPVAPLGVYGASKEAGERLVRSANPRHAILRTAWVVSPWGNNFVKTMLRLGAERPKLGVVADQIGCPTSAIDIAAALLTITDRLRGDATAPTGTWHFVNAGAASWHDLARFIFDRAAAQGRPAPELAAITTADYPTPAKRPANSRLATDRITVDFGIVPRPWQAAVGEVVDELLGEKTA